MAKNRRFATPSIVTASDSAECGCFMLTYDDGALRSQPCECHGATVPTSDFVPMSRAAFERFRWAQLTA